MRGSRLRIFFRRVRDPACRRAEAQGSRRRDDRAGQYPPWKFERRHPCGARQSFEAKHRRDGGVEPAQIHHREETRGHRGEVAGLAPAAAREEAHEKHAEQ